MSRSTSAAFAGIVALARASVVHDNYIDFPGALSVGWQETAFAVTSGQPYEGVSTQASTIDIKAGRRGSNAPAQDFADQLSFDAHFMGSGRPKDQRPAELNFASFGTLTARFGTGATRTCHDMRIGQGHEGAKNNWWLASPNCARDHDEFVCEPCGLVLTPGRSDHEFAIREIGVPASPASAPAEGPASPVQPVHPDPARVQPDYPSYSAQHYGNPEAGCRSDEVEIPVEGGSGSFCSPRCDYAGTCPNAPTTVSDVTAKPVCARIPSGAHSCALECTPWVGECGRGQATCRSMDGTGVCAFERSLERLRRLREAAQAEQILGAALAPALV